ncbi:hypothetical protein PENTCL1PPCAC_7022, partial [Pristionchus entomophagus]
MWVAHLPIWRQNMWVVYWMGPLCRVHVSQPLGVVAMLITLHPFTSNLFKTSVGVKGAVYICVDLFFFAPNSAISCRSASLPPTVVSVQFALPDIIIYG